MFENWKSFYFDGGLASGLVDSPDAWKEIKEAYRNDPFDFDVLRRRDYFGADHFGFGSCYTGKTLADFAKQNGMRL